MRLRQSARGAFWGCVTYPNCKGTIDAATSAKPPAAYAPQAHGTSRAIRSKYPGKCTKCSAAVEVGALILYADRRIVGCTACSPAETLSFAPTNVQGGVARQVEVSNAKAWDGLLADDAATAVVQRPQPLPPTVEECAAVKLCPFELDEHQQRVVSWRKGEALVAAAAGSGKSTVLLERMAALVREGCAPERIITLVYNKKAAEDLRARSRDRLGFILGERIAVFTFHGWAYTLINEWWPNRFGRNSIVGVDGGPSGLTLALRAKEAAGLSDIGEIKNVVKLTELVREALIDVDRPEAAQQIQELLPVDITADEAWQLVQFTRAYQAEKAQAQAIDFADMLYLVTRVIEHGGTRAKQLAERYAHVQVDECFPGDTPILLANGTTKSIREIVEGTEPLPEVLSYDVATRQQVVKRVIGVKKTLLQKRTVRIVARRVGYGSDGARLAPLTEKVRFGLRYLVCTEDHRLFRTDGTEVHAGDVRPGERLHLESSAPQVPAFNHKYKIGVTGRTTLRTSLASRVMPRGTSKSGPTIRGGNGQGLTVPQRALLEALGADWQAEYIVNTNGGRQFGLPTHYKIDIAHVGCRIAIEVDGETHRGVRREADERKEAFLRACGWRVYRFSNVEAVQQAKVIASQMPKDCPVEAEVLAVEEHPIKDYYVYDLSVEDTHTYYANGLLVHNCQDINPARLKVALHLAQGARSLTMVGDLRQSIYSFTGARPDLFKSRIEHATFMTLPINRRSTQFIVEAGNKVASGRDWNLGGDCKPASTNVATDAEDVRVWWTEHSGDEADAVAAEVLTRTAEGEKAVPLATAGGKMNYACLVRTNAQAGDLEIAFTMRKLPCRVVGSKGGVWASNAGRDFLAYLRAAEGGSAGADLARIANKPARFLRRAVAETAGLAPDTIEALRVQYNNRGARTLALDLEYLRDCEWVKRCDEVLRFLVRDLKDRAMDADEAITPDEDKAEAYRGLCALAKDMGSVAAIDQQIELMSRVKEKDPAVEICTMHKSKGAEWHTVFVCGVADGMLPHRKTRDIEEERRLFYVAVTRAQKICVISVGGPKPSPFVSAIVNGVPEETRMANVKAVPPTIRRRVTRIDATDERNVRVESIEVNTPEERAAALADMAGMSMADAHALNETFGHGWVEALPEDQREELLKTASRAQIETFIDAWTKRSINSQE